MVEKKFKRTKVLTIPYVKLDLDIPVFLKINSKWEEKPKSKNDKFDGIQYRAEAVNLETGELCYLSPFTALYNIINDKYPKDTYVGKSFEITKLSKSSKGFNRCSVFEVE